MSVQDNDREKSATGPAAALRIGGLTKFTTIDYPGKMAAVIYAQGCPLRCTYCHNPEMQAVYPACAPGSGAPPSWTDILSFLHKRRAMLEGVVFSGGEPLFQKVLPELMAEVKALGFAIGLHTTGLPPERLRKVLPLADWVGFDVKTRFEEYETVTRVPGTGDKARTSFGLLLESGTDHEIRTTIDPDLIPSETLLRLAAELKAAGVTRYRLQESSARRRDYPEAVEKEIGAMFPDFEIRRAPALTPVRKAA